MKYIIETINGLIKTLNDVKGYALAKDYTENYKPKPVFRNNVIKFKDLTQNTFNSKTRDLVKTKESDEEMKGSVTYREKDKRYMGRFYFLGQRYYVYGKSETEAWNKIRAKRKELKEVKREDNTISKNMALNTWFDFWSENFKKQEVRESTYSKINENYDRYIRDTIGKKKINSIDYITVQQFINGLNAYTPKKKCMEILSQLFNLLVKEKYITKDPMNMVIMPIKNKESKVIDKKNKIITSTEEGVIFESLKEKDMYYYAIKFILYTGLRRGETLGLIWKNVDLDNNKIYIDRQYNNAVKKITEPKTPNSVRYVPLLPEAREVLLDLTKEPHFDNDFVFPKLQRLTQRTSYLSNKLGIHFTVHTLRHTFASRLYAAGVSDKAIQDILGHEKVDTTLNVYVHLLKKEDSELIQRVREFFVNNNIIHILE